MFRFNIPVGLFQRGIISSITHVSLEASDWNFSRPESCRMTLLTVLGCLLGLFTRAARFLGKQVSVGNWTYVMVSQPDCLLNGEDRKY